MLDTNLIKTYLQEKGLTQAALADICGVSREAASNWLSGESFPRPGKLKAIADALGVEANDLCAIDESAEPVIAFRMRKNQPLTPEAESAADTAARRLRELVPFLQNGVSFAPPVLENPALDDAYIVETTRQVRLKAGATAAEPLSLDHILNLHRSFGTVLVPVLWDGAKDGHENALSVFLPDSKTSFVVISLNAHADDFHYWLAHELGHCYSLHALRGDEGEKFAERFAQELLFPLEYAGIAYKEVMQSSEPAEVYEEHAKKFQISAVTVIRQMDRYASSSGQEITGLETPIFWQRWNATRSEVPTLSKMLFGTNQPEPERFVKMAEEVFKTSIYQAISKWQEREGGRSPAFIASALNIGLSDAYQLSHVLAKPSVSTEV